MKKKPYRSLGRTIVLGMVSLIVVMEVVSAAISYIVYSGEIQGQYKENADMIAVMVSTVMDTDNLEMYLETGEKDEAYLRTERILKNIADSEDCAVIYIAKVDEENWTRTYIYDVVSDASGFYPYEIGTTDDTEESFMESYKSFHGDEENYNTSAYGTSDQIGQYVTSAYPLKNSDGEIVAVSCVVKTMTALATGRKILLQQLLIWAIVLAAAVGLINGLLLRFRVLIPLKKIVKETKRFANDQTLTDSNLPESVPGNNEIREVAYAVEQMEIGIMENVQKLLDITKEKNRISTELDIATKIQSNALPKICETFPGREEIDVSAMMTPAKEVGGDFYDCFFVDKDHFAMVIADVSGKGIPAALFMMVSKVLIKTITMQGYEPGEILEIVNQKLCENNDTGMFVTVWIGILDLATGVIKASNGGHEYPMISRGSNAFEIYKDKHGFVLGGIGSMKYETYELTLHKGDRIFLYTDGLPEAIDQNASALGMDEMVRFLNESGEMDSEHQIQYVIQKAEEFTKGAEQFDDTTVLCLYYKGRNSQQVTRRFASNVASITKVTEFVDGMIAEQKLSESGISKINIAIDEVFGNIARYSDCEAVDVMVDISAVGKVSIEFSDSGEAFDPLNKEDPDTTAEAEDRPIGGLGIFLTKQLMDGVVYRREGEKNILTIEKRYE